MATRKGYDTLSFKGTIAVAGLVGLAGGALFGIWDSVTVLVVHAPRPVPLPEILSLSAYSVALSSVMGGLGTAAVGIAAAAVVRIGRYRIRKSQLAGIFAGVFALFAIYVLLAPYTPSDNILAVAESTVICLLGGTGLASLSIFALDRGASREGLVAVGVASLVSLLVLVYGGLWVNLNLLSGEALFRPARLLANIGVLLFAGLLGFGMRIVVRSVVGRYAPRRIEQGGAVLLTLLVCALVSVSLTGPFSLGSSAKAEASPEAMAGPQEDEERPNILWIVMDTVRADHLSSYGYYRDTTPAIDEIAAQGALFEQAISAAPWTLPSHASMFTGLYPHSHGTDAEHQWLDDDFLTVAEVLRAHGWETYGYTNNYFAGPRTNLDQGFDTFVVGFPDKAQALPELTNHLRVKFVGQKTQIVSLQDDGAHRTNETVKKWMNDATRAGRPFFIFINYMEVHAPYRPPKEFAVPFLDRNTTFEDAMSVNQDYYDYVTGKLEVDSEDFESLSALYDGALAYLDFKIGQLVDYLRELGVLDSTVVIITSDHGESLGDHNLMGHQLSVYDTLLHVPLIIRYPDAFDPGTVVQEGVQLVDLLPTVLDIAGIDRDGIEHHGYSLLRERGGLVSRPLVAEYAIFGNVLELLTRANPSFDVSTYARRLKAIRTEELKYIWSSDGRDELYHISQDPGELNNLIDTEPEKARELKGLLNEWLESFEPYRSRAGK